MGVGSVFMMFLLFGGLAIAIRFIAGMTDSDRVRNYIAQQGGELLDKQWKPFGRGWMGEKDSRIYQITYSDRDGNIHEAFCKTSLWSGVYLTDDHIIEYAQARPVAMTIDNRREIEDLKTENERLKRELQRARGNEPLNL